MRKPYGFCCSQASDSAHLHPRKTYSQSLASLSESPALRYTEYDIEKAPKGPDSASLNTVQVSLASSPGKQYRSATESELELRKAMDRKQRQIEYERKMDRLAELAESRREL